MEVREQYVRAASAFRIRAEATRAMMGMSSPEWSGYLSKMLGVPGSPARDQRRDRRANARPLRQQPPLIPGAVEAVRRLAKRWPIGIASSSNPSLIEAVVHAAGIDDVVQVALSSEEVGRGKPAPDVYLETVRRLEAEPGALRSNRRLGARPPLRQDRRPPRDRRPKPPFPPKRRSAGAGRRRADEHQRADRTGRRTRLTTPSATSRLCDVPTSRHRSPSRRTNNPQFASNQPVAQT